LAFGLVVSGRRGFTATRFEGLRLEENRQRQRQQQISVGGHTRKTKAKEDELRGGVLRFPGRDADPFGMKRKGDEKKRG
jgi:hypothetical protein